LIINTSWPFVVNENIAEWAFWDTAFSKEECEKIIELGKKQILETGCINSDGKNIVDEHIRISNVSWLFPSNDTEWIYKRLTYIIVELNKRFFNYDLYGIIEGLQFTEYFGDRSGMYTKHIDSTSNGVIRKISVSVQLSELNSYEGGSLLLHTSSNPQEMGKDVGKLIMFPSFVLHEVTPVKKGTRYSLVAWVTGPPLK